MAGLLSTMGCEFVTGSRSTCDAMCAWAVACHAEERSIDASGLRSDCLAAANAVDSTCEAAENAALGFDAVADIGPCLDAIDDRTRDLECGPFTGTETEIQTGTPPAQCVGAGRDAGAVFEAAQFATSESSASLCQRLQDQLCAETAACVASLWRGKIPADVIMALGEPALACAAALESVFGASCVADDLYGVDEDASEPNPARELARACLVVWQDTPPSCEALQAGRLDGECDAAFAGAAEGVGQALASTLDQFAP